jgi:hypothetical protein
LGCHQRCQFLIPIRIQAASAPAVSSAPQLASSKPASPPPCRLDVILNAKRNYMMDEIVKTFFNRNDQQKHGKNDSIFQFFSIF